MKKDKILEAINKYFSSASPEDIIGKLEELGCEFEDVQFLEIPEYSHFIDSRVKSLTLSCSSKSIHISGISKTEFLIKEISQLDTALNMYSCNDENYNEMMIAA
ncbi:MAG: hypothetical protein Q9M50_13875 [Methylococcales bacterium]|nr:hypothetical protein [Methylococcales bacterium]